MSRSNDADGRAHAQAAQGDIASSGSADFWADTLCTARGNAFIVDPCKPRSEYLPAYSDTFGFDHAEAKRGPLDVPIRPWEAARHQHFGFGAETVLDEHGFQAAKPSAPTSAFQAYSTLPRHHRFASTSSGFYEGDRYVAVSDPGSDLSSEYSDLFQASGLPAPALSPVEGRYEAPVRPSQSSASGWQTSLPDFVVEELKRLKLENMALRRMAQEVVRIDVGPGCLSGRSIDTSDLSCSHHAPLTSSPRLPRVLEGADPLRVYADAAAPHAEPSMSEAKPKYGTAASMWAPGARAAVASPRETGVPTSRGPSGFALGESASADPGRRVATASTLPTAMRAAAQLSETQGFSDLSLASAVLPSHARCRSASNGSPRSSPGSASLTPSKLETAPAATLVGMILDRRGQDASLLLQQQLKNGAPERQKEILEAIRARMVPLSHDRHGNFLVQAAIEARPDNALHLKGAFVELTMSQFGCHVVQKALEGEEDVRMAVTEELLGSRLDQTLTSRHSIHVWQRILESEWTRPGFREQIFASINCQLRGRWARTARQETGSIICQNIFESAQPDEKAQCVQEVLDELDECATNQWGVWVVQHIIEHGAQEECRAALKGMVRSAAKLTLSQYGQKAVMSGLKTGDAQFLQEYVDAMCQSAQPRRPPLIDVCLAAHGIQIVTQLLTTVDQKTRERIISTVRRNSVFLKGSKAGMRVHQLCERARAFAGY